MLGEASGLGVCIAGLNIPDLAFADDLVLFASSPEEMNKLLAIVHRHSIQWRYSVNAAKCAIAVIGTKAQEQEGARQHFKLGSERLATDQDYEYLGVLLSALKKKKNGSSQMLVVVRLGHGLSGRPTNGASHIILLNNTVSSSLV